MITPATQGAKVFCHGFMQVSPLLPGCFFHFISCFWGNVFEYRHQVNDFHLFVFTSVEGDDSRGSSVHL